MGPIIEQDRDGFYVINVKAEKIEEISAKTVAHFKSERVEYVLSFKDCYFQPGLNKHDIFVIAKQTSTGGKLFAFIAVNRDLYNMFSEVTPIENRMEAIKRFLKLSTGEKNNIFLQMGKVHWTPELEIAKLNHIKDLQLKHFLCREVLSEPVSVLYRSLAGCSKDNEVLFDKEYLNICFSNEPVHYHISVVDLLCLQEETFLTEDAAWRLMEAINNGATRILLVGSTYDIELVGKALAKALEIPYASRDVGSFSAGLELLGETRNWRDSMCGALTGLMLDVMSESAVFLLESIDNLGASREHGSAKKALRKMLAKDRVYDPFYNIDLPIGSSIVLCSAEDQSLIDQAALSCFDSIIDINLNDNERIAQARQFVELNRLTEFTDDALKLISDYSVDMVDFTEKLTRLSSGRSETAIDVGAAEAMLKDVLPSDPYRVFKISRKLYSPDVAKKISELHARLIRAESGNEFDQSVILRDKLDLLYGLKQHRKPDFDMGKFIEVATTQHIGHRKVIDEIAEFFNYLKASGDINTLHAYFVGEAGTGKSDLGEAVGVASGMNVVRIDMPAIGLDYLTGASANHKAPRASILTTSISSGPCVFIMEEFEKADRNVQNFCLKLLDSGHSFRDHYLDVNVSLDDCIFIATANDFPMLKCMLDRFRVFEFTPYNTLEKARLLNMFTENAAVAFDGAAKVEILNHCSGGSARPLKRAVERLSEHAVAAGTDIVNLEHVNRIFGTASPLYISKGEKPVGVVNGLAVGAQGGIVIQVEAKAFKSVSSSMEVTGNVDERVREAASTGKDYLVGTELIDECRLHVHYPNAHSKEGNSSGVAMTLAIYSASKKLCVPDNVAFTGEISLCGKVLPVGAVPEKIEGAIKSEVTKVFIPAHNYHELMENAEYFEFLRSKIEIVPVGSFEEILDKVELMPM